jgi:hypothetical protein
MTTKVTELISPLPLESKNIGDALMKIPVKYILSFHFIPVRVNYWNSDQRFRDDRDQDSQADSELGDEY